MKDNNIVTMMTTFVVTTRNPVSFKKEGVEFHGLGATVEGKDIPFDFTAFTYNVKDLEKNQYHFQYKSGRGALYNNYGLDECFNEAYEALGVNPEDLTAERIAGMTRLNEFLMEPDDSNGDILYVNILEMVFSDGEKEYPVSRSAIEQWEVAVNYRKSIF